MQWRRCCCMGREELVQSRRGCWRIISRWRRGCLFDHKVWILESSQTTPTASMKKLKPITPGELLLEEFLKPMGISQYRLAKEINVPPQRIGEIVAGKRA